MGHGLASFRLTAGLDPATEAAHDGFWSSKTPVEADTVPVR